MVGGKIMGFESRRWCQGISRQQHRPCHIPPIPFGDFCRFHGGNTKFQRQKAEQRLREYLTNSTDPPFVKGVRYRQWRDSDRRWRMRRAKKKGPEYVAALEREWAAEKAERQAWIDEKRRLRAEARAQTVEEYRQRTAGQMTPTPDPYSDPSADPFGQDFDLGSVRFDFNDL